MKYLIRPLFLIAKFILICTILMSCIKSKDTRSVICDNNGIDENIIYAKGFKITNYPNFKKVTVKNPWQKNAIQQCFYLVKCDTIITPSYGIKITIPVDNIAISSCTHTEFLALLNQLNYVSAMCSPELIYNDSLRNMYDSGKIISIGDAYSTDIERLLIANPDVYFVSSYNQQDENTKRLVNSGIPVVYNNEWTETSLLARAEWIKYIAAFCDKSEMADSIFSQIETNYKYAINTIASIENNHPKVMVGGNFKGTWYMPGGKSYMGQLLSDAGADYYYSKDTTTTSMPLNFEIVLKNFSNSDIWLNAPVSTIDELIKMDERHGLFLPTKTGRVYSFYKRIKPGGANDFWESAIAHPDIILYDVAWALYPDLFSKYEPTYILKVQ